MEAEVQSLITAREKKIEEIHMSFADIQVCISAQSLLYILMYSFAPEWK